MKLCKDCKYYSRSLPIAPVAYCMHKVSKLADDYVEGDKRYTSCNSMRTVGACNSSGRLFEEKTSRNFFRGLFK